MLFKLVRSLVKCADLFGDRGSQDDARVVDLEMGLGGRYHAAVQIDEWFGHDLARKTERLILWAWCAFDSPLRRVAHMVNEDGQTHKLQPEAQAEAEGLTARIMLEFVEGPQHFTTVLRTSILARRGPGIHLSK